MKYKMSNQHIDVRTAVKTVTEEFGIDAPFIAAQRADAMLASGDLEGARQWRSIFRIVADAQRTTRRDADTLH